MEDSPNPSASPTFSPPSASTSGLSRKRKLSPRSRSRSRSSESDDSPGLSRKRKLSSRSRSRSRSSESDDSFRSELKCGKHGGSHVSKWDNYILESLGIFYDEKATELSELTKPFLKWLYLREFYGIKDRDAFWTKLLEIKECLLESTKKCMRSIDEESAMSCKLDEIEKCLMQARRNMKEEFMSKIGSASSDYLSSHLFSIWYTAITEFVQYYSDLLKDIILLERIEVESPFTQLLTLFSKIFLLNPVRGDAWQKVQMILNGVVTASVPDIRYIVLGDPASLSTGSSLITVAVGEVKKWQFSNMEKTTDFNIRDLKFQSQSVGNLLGQHGGELLVEIMNSKRHACLGIICIQTTIIFTRLDLSPRHLEKLKNTEQLEDERSRIHYSRPYNFLVRKDREEILDTMFQVGLLCRVRSLFFQD